MNKEGKVFRLLYVILFYIVFSFSDIVLLLLTLVQSVLVIFQGEPSRTLQRFGASLGIYLKQISEYLAYHSEHKPYPFADWPEPELADQEVKASS